MGEKTFRDFGIDLDTGFTGEKYATCPECSPHRKKKNVKCLSGNWEKGVWNCAHCGWTGTLKQGTNNKSQLYPIKRDYSKPDYRESTLPEKVVAWFGKRGISKIVLERNKIGYGQVYMPQVEDRVNAIKFPYYRGGEVVNIKYRDGKKNFRMESGAERILYGLDDITGNKVIIVEGEIDKLSLEMAGYLNVLSVPDGAPSVNSRNYEKKFEFLETVTELMESLLQVIIAVDNDAPGKKLEEELARRIGKERCKLVSWPEGCKDANDVLVKMGAEELKEFIERSAHYPISGIFELSDLESKVDYLYHNGIQGGEYPGWDSLNDYYTVRPGEWTLVTGIPSHGKSSFIDAMVVRMAKDLGWPFGYYSPENQPIERHVSRLMELHTGFPFYEGYSERLPEDVYEFSKTFIQDYFSFVLPQEDDDQTLNNILTLSSALVLRKGIKGLVIDPWNEIDHTVHRDFTETEYISQSLSKIRRFARHHGIHIWLIAHPTKLRKENNGKYPVPTPYDVAGSAHFRNKSDNALCVWRDLNNEDMSNIVQIHIQKIRFKEIGKIGMVELRYEKTTGDFHELNFS